MLAVFVIKNMAAS